MPTFSNTNVTTAPVQVVQLIALDQSPTCKQVLRCLDRDSANHEQLNSLLLRLRYDGPNVLLIAATYEGRVVGYALAEILTVTHGDRVLVVHHCRSKRPDLPIVDKLLEYGDTWCRMRGVHTLRLEVDPAEHPEQAWLRVLAKHSFKCVSYVMERPVK